jgi:hypothetical protein
MAALREGLAKLGWIKGRNLQIDPSIQYRRSRADFAAPSKRALPKV